MMCELFCSHRYAKLLATTDAVLQVLMIMEIKAGLGVGFGVIDRSTDPRTSSIRFYSDHEFCYANRANRIYRKQ